MGWRGNCKCRWGPGSAWTYDAEFSNAPRAAFFSEFTGNARRMPNGTTVITESSWGRVFEVESHQPKSHPIADRRSSSPDLNPGSGLPRPRRIPIASSIGFWPATASRRAGVTPRWGAPHQEDRGRSLSEQSRICEDSRRLQPSPRIYFEDCRQAAGSMEDCRHEVQPSKCGPGCPARVLRPLCADVERPGRVHIRVSNNDTHSSPLSSHSLRRSSSRMPWRRNASATSG